MSFSSAEINIRLWCVRFLGLWCVRFLAVLAVVSGEYYVIKPNWQEQLGCSLTEILLCPNNPDFSREDYFDPTCRPLSGNQLVLWNGVPKNVSGLLQKRLPSCSDWGPIICVVRDCGVWLNEHTIGSTHDYRWMDRIWPALLFLAIGAGILCGLHYLTKNSDCWNSDCCRQSSENSDSAQGRDVSPSPSLLHLS